MSYRTVREPTDEEIEELKRMKRQEVGRVAMRAHMILLSVRDYSPSTIADLHGMSHPTVYKWIDRFDAEGPVGLYDRERVGWPSLAARRSPPQSVLRHPAEILTREPDRDINSRILWN